MRINYGGKKKRREEAQKKKQEEKRMRRLNKSKNENAPEETPYDPFQVDPPPQA